MRRFKKWLIDHFLPMWAKESLLKDYTKLMHKVAELERRLERKEAYIAGLEDGIRAQRRIVINTGEVKK